MMYDPSALTGKFAEDYRRFGGLTSDQIRDFDKPAPQQAKPECNVDHIVQAFRIAQSKGVARPKILLDGFRFKLAPDYGVNKGALYITLTDDPQTYLGKIQNGRFLPVAACSSQQKERIVAAATDPFGSVVAFGKQFGRCSICARLLTDPESVAAGIGPICREKFGW